MAQTAASCQLVRRRIISGVPFMEEVTDRLCLRKRSTRGTEVTVDSKELLHTKRSEKIRTGLLRSVFLFYTTIRNGRQEISGDESVENRCLMLKEKRRKRQGKYYI